MSSYVLERVGERASGYVHSVFATSFNVALDGFLFHVGDSRHPLSCCGANVAPDRLAAMLARCRPGDRAIVKRRALRVYDVAGTWELDLGALEEQSLSIASPVARGRLAALEGAVAALGVEGLIGLARDARLSKVVRALERPDPTEDDLRRAVGFLLGRGPGLTPSGDDVLVGYGVARWLCGGAEAFARVVREAPLWRTTDVSASYLEAVARGFANQGYCELAQTAASGDEGRFPALLADLQRVGHTSGNDGLFGFLVGLRSVLRG